MVAGQIESGSSDQPLLFGIRNTGRSTAKGGILSFSHFDKNQHIIVPHNQIDFTKTTAEISFNEHKALFFQKG